MTPELAGKINAAKQILAQSKSVLVAYSGGVDSTLILALAVEVLGDRAAAATVVSALLPEKEKQAAIYFTKERGIRHLLVETQELELPEFASNTANRCYICKKIQMSALLDKAGGLGLSHVAHGANVDDFADYRPGLKAAKELEILSPLVDAGLGKTDIRAALQAMGLAVWNKPSMACLASRIPFGSQITVKKLEMVEQAEDFLREIGVGQCRVRHHKTVARIEVEPCDFGKLFKESVRKKIMQEFKNIGFSHTSLDLAGYQTGSLNKDILVPDKNFRGHLK